MVTHDPKLANKAKRKIKIKDGGAELANELEKKGYENFS